MLIDLTLKYEAEPLSGANSNVIYAPIMRIGTLQSFDILTDEPPTVDCVFSLAKNGVLVTGSQATVVSGTRLVTVSGLSVALVKGDEITLTMLSGTLNSPITLNLVVEDGASGGLTTEQVQDIVAAMMIAGTNSSWIYDDAAGTLKVDAPQLTTEEVQDRIGALLSGGANTTVTYNDGANTLTIAETTAGKTSEDIQDVVAGLLAQGSNVTLTYDDAGNTLTVAATGGSGGAALPSQTGNGGKVLGTDGANLSWVTQTGGGSQTGAIYNADSPPVTVQAENDEFLSETHTIDSKWTVSRAGTIIEENLNTTLQSVFFIKIGAFGRLRLAQPFAPSGDFSLTLAGYLAPTANYQLLGLKVRDATAQNDLQFYFGFANAVSFVAHRTINGATTYNVAQLNADRNIFSKAYLHIQRKSGVFTLWYSNNGVVYIQIYSNSQAILMSEFEIAVENVTSESGSGQTPTHGGFDWIRRDWLFL